MSTSGDSENRLLYLGALISDDGSSLQSGARDFGLITELYRLAEQRRRHVSKMKMSEFLACGASP
jgi:hypothetical protein